MRVFQIIFFTLTPFFAHCLDLSSNLKEEFQAPKFRILVGLDHTTRSKNVENLKAELQLFELSWKNSLIALTQKSSDLKRHIEQLRQETVRNPTSQILLRKLNLLAKHDQVICELIEIQNKTITLLKEHVEFWEKYFLEIKCSTCPVEEKSIYSFLDLQNVMKKVFLCEEQLTAYALKKEGQLAEISKQEHFLVIKEKEFDAIQFSIDHKRKQLEVSKDEIVLLDMEKDVVAQEMELARLRLNFHQKYVDFLQNKEITTQERMQLFKDHSQAVRTCLYIDSTDLEQYQKKKNEQQKGASVRIAELSKSRSEIIVQKIAAQEELDRLRKRFKIQFTKIKQLEDLVISAYSISDNYALYCVAHTYALVATYERELYKIKAEITLEEIKVQQAQILSETVKLLYEISQGHIKNSELFERERLAYKTIKKNLITDLKMYKEQLLVQQDIIQDSQKTLINLHEQEEKLKIIGEEVSAFHQKKWHDCVHFLSEIIKNLQQQHEVLAQKNTMYQQIITCQEEMLESVDCTLREFDEIGVWHRSMSAVTWEGIKNIIPHVHQFFTDFFVIMQQALTGLTLSKCGLIISKMSIGKMLGIFLLIFTCFFFFLFLQTLLPTLQESLMASMHSEFDRSMLASRQIFAIMLGVVVDLFKPLYLWMLSVFYIFFYHPSPAFLLLFCCLSIILWLCVSRKVLTHFIQINSQFDYFLLRKRLIGRFCWVFSFFSITTIILLIFRKMFMMVMVYQQSEFPNILLRLYHIVIFLSIIFSLDKEELLNFLPAKSTIWTNIAHFIDRYFYIFLMGIFCLLVMSDPYLGGYGTLVWHVFWNTLMTMLLLSCLFLLHKIIRQNSSIFFFQEDNSLLGISERFDYAKTWYALYILGLMFFFVFIATISTAYVWGYGFTYATLRKILTYELFKIESVSSTGKIIPDSFKLYNMLYIISLSFFGVVLAYLFKKFVLKRIFDIQYVDPGIQNTLTIISRYVIIIASVMIACIQSKLGYLVYYVSVFGLATFGWSFKDLFTDFVAYFFILVQRPVKLGDYVKIDEEVMGVVRKISPRAVILRRKNAVSIVVPNSTVLKSSLYNWNYTRGYIGLDDIEFTVPFGTNIELVRTLCFKILDENDDVLKTPQPFVRLINFEDKGYLFMVRGFVSSGNTLRQWDITSNLRFALVEKFHKEHIAIAGPTIKVTIKKEELLP